MSHEVWLRPNRRPALIAAAAILLLSGAIAALPRVAAWIRISFVAVAGFAAVIVLYQGGRPRIARRGAELLFRLGGNPTAVPLEIVEAFFLGQGPAQLPGRVGERLESVNLLARLSQKRDQWLRHVNPRLGSWCDGYITIRGTSCEPLSVDVAHRLNRLLAEAKQELANDE